MAGWSFEPGHTAAHFRARHMMISWVRGHFPDVHGTLEFDPGEPEKSKVEVDIDAAKICTGEEARDEHLRSADFLDTDKHPRITFRGKEVEVIIRGHGSSEGNGERYPLRGKPLRYSKPFGSIAEQDWDVLG